MPWGLAIGGGVGLLDSALQAQTAGQQQKLQAAIAKWSPWTGMKAQPVTPVNPLTTALPFAATGASIANANNMNSALVNRLNAGLLTGSDLASASQPLPSLGGYNSPTVGQIGAAPAAVNLSPNGSMTTPQAMSYLSSTNPMYGNQMQNAWWNISAPNQPYSPYSGGGNGGGATGN